MYIIGRSIQLLKINLSKTSLITIFTTINILIILQYYYFKDLASGHGYNNPLLVSQAVIVFFHSKNNSKNNFINTIAASSFAVYLIHDSDFGHYYILKIMTTTNSYIFNPISYLLTLIILGCFIYLLCTLSDKILQYIYNPIIRIISNKYIFRTS